MKLLSGPELAERWGEIKPYVEAALAHGTGDVTSYGMFLKCLGAVAQCWETEHGFAITSFEELEGNKRLAIVTGTSSDWFKEGPDALARIEEFAKDHGCKSTIIYGRKGWKRTLKQYGYHEPYITLIKELE